MNLRTRIDILRDRRNPPLMTNRLLITDDGIPLRIWESSFHIYTPFPRTCTQFGANTQHEFGCMIHGNTNKKVNEPYVGQPIFLRTEEHRIANTHRKVAAIYRELIQLQIPDLAVYFSDFFNYFKEKQDQIWQSQFVTIAEAAADTKINQYFIQVVYSAFLSKLHTNGWTISYKESIWLRDLARSHLFNLNFDDILASGLLFKMNRKLVLSDALVVLYMNAIHRARPDDTYFDKNGILRLNQ